MLYRTIWLFLDSVHRLICGSFAKDHNVSETGSVSVLRWMGQGRPTQLGPSERASLNHKTSRGEIIVYVVQIVSCVGISLIIAVECCG
jgi:hypothetical protein